MHETLDVGRTAVAGVVLRMLDNLYKGGHVD